VQVVLTQKKKKRKRKRVGIGLENLLEPNLVVSKIEDLWK